MTTGARGLADSTLCLEIRQNLLANHDPGSSKLREILSALPPSPHAELRIAAGGLLGYALYDPAILPLSEAQTRFAAVL